MIEHALNRIGFAFAGISLIVLGAGTFFDRGFYDDIYYHYFDFGVHHRAVGLLFAAVGIACVYLASRKRTTGEGSRRR